MIFVLNLLGFFLVGLYLTFYKDPIINLPGGVFSAALLAAIYFSAVSLLKKKLRGKSNVDRRKVIEQRLSDGIVRKLVLIIPIAGYLLNFFYFTDTSISVFYPSLVVATYITYYPLLK